MDRFSNTPLVVSNENATTQKAKTARFRVVEHAGRGGVLLQVTVQIDQGGAGNTA